MNKNFTKADLKVGYVVKLRDGSLEMVMMSSVGGDNNPRLISIEASGSWTDTSRDIDDNLCRNDNNHDYDIVEVYGYSKYAHCALKVSTDDRELLWKREETKKVMTYGDYIRHLSDEELAKLLSVVVGNAVWSSLIRFVGVDLPYEGRNCLEAEMEREYLEMFKSEAKEVPNADKSDN